MPRRDAERADEADDEREAPRELQEARAGGRVARVAVLGLRHRLDRRRMVRRRVGAGAGSSSGTATSRSTRSVGTWSGSELAPRTRFRPCSLAR